MWIVKNGLMVITQQEWLITLLFLGFFSYILGVIVMAIQDLIKLKKIDRWLLELPIEDYRKYMDFRRKYGIWNREFNRRLLR